MPQEITIRIRYSDTNEGYMYDVYSHDIEPQDGVEPFDGGLCTGRAVDALEMASDAVRKYVELNSWDADMMRVKGNCESCGKDYEFYEAEHKLPDLKCPHCGEESGNWDTPDSPQMAPSIVEITNQEPKE